MPEPQVHISLPEPHYTLFNSQRSGLPEVVVVNDALLSFASIEVFPWHLCITLQAEELIENGMPSPAESELLFRLGDELEAAVLQGRTEHNSENALFLARSTWNEVRELLFQVHDPEVTHVALQQRLNCRKWEREWSYRMQNEPQWSSASNLFQLFSQARGRDA